MEELAPAPLRNGPGEEQLQTIFRKQRFLILKEQGKMVKLYLNKK